MTAASGRHRWWHECEVWSWGTGMDGGSSIDRCAAEVEGEGSCSCGWWYGGLLLTSFVSTMGMRPYAIATHQSSMLLMKSEVVFAVCSIWEVLTCVEDRHRAQQASMAGVMLARGCCQRKYAMPNMARNAVDGSAR